MQRHLIHREIGTAMQLTSRQQKLVHDRILAAGARQGFMSVSEIMTRAQVGRKLSIGPKGPTLAVLLALCKALEVPSVDHLLGPASSTALLTIDDLAAGLDALTFKRVNDLLLVK